ncbi:PorT family protein [Bacteroidales bacterium OttesenSCG-928-L03]|nr:PorT family protein [Bacteroidales bacterium OttesenSCG-928-L03]
MKRYWIGFVVLFLAQTLTAQTEFEPEWSFGVNGGVTLSKVSFSSTEATSPQKLLQDYVGGITVRYISEKNFGLQAELNYSLRGWEEKVDTVAYFNEYARSLAYLELPIMTHIYFNMSKRTRLVFNLGPQISYLVSEKELKREEADDNTINITYYDTKVQNKFDYGLTGGLGLEVRTGIGSFILGGRYYYGLGNIFKSGRGDRFQASSNQVIGIKLSYLFRL